jgi:hypothetical protein
VVDHYPMIQWTRKRQRRLTCLRTDLSGVCAHVGATKRKHQHTAGNVALCCAVLGYSQGQRGWERVGHLGSARDHYPLMLGSDRARPRPQHRRHSVSDHDRLNFRRECGHKRDAGVLCRDSPASQGPQTYDQ